METLLYNTLHGVETLSTLCNMLHENIKGFQLLTTNFVHTDLYYGNNSLVNMFLWENLLIIQLHTSGGLYIRKASFICTSVAFYS